jgi:hypothetical protein
MLEKFFNNIIIAFVLRLISISLSKTTRTIIINMKFDQPSGTYNHQIISCIWSTCLRVSNIHYSFLIESCNPTRSDPRTGAGSTLSGRVIGGAPAGNELAIASPRKNLGKQYKFIASPNCLCFIRIDYFSIFSELFYSRS